MFEQSFKNIDNELHKDAGGNAGVVIKNTFLSNGDATEVRRELLESCNLYAILDLPAKVFSAGVKTVVLFFKKGEPTKKIWYYQLNLDRNLGKTPPLNENDLADFLECFKGQKETKWLWTKVISLFVISMPLMVGHTQPIKEH